MVTFLIYIFLLYFFICLIGSHSIGHQILFIVSIFVMLFLLAIKSESKPLIDKKYNYHVSQEIK